MASNEHTKDNEALIERLVREIEEAELFVQKLRACIVAIHDELADGQAGRALSMCQQALTEIDGATDVVTHSPRLDERAGLEADLAPPSAKPA
jgi:hypothetical protein